MFVFVMAIAMTNAKPFGWDEYDEVPEGRMKTMRKPDETRKVPVMKMPERTMLKMSRPNTRNGNNKAGSKTPARPLSFAERLAVLREQEEKEEERRRLKEKQEFLALYDDKEEEEDTFPRGRAGVRGADDDDDFEDDDEEDYRFGNPFRDDFDEEDEDENPFIGISRLNDDDEDDDVSKISSLADEKRKAEERKERIRQRLRDREYIRKANKNKRKPQNREAVSDALLSRRPALRIGGLNLKARTRQREELGERTHKLNPLNPEFQQMHRSNINAWRRKMVLN